jgi:riboflavin synthase alpha subunit
MFTGIVEQVGRVTAVRSGPGATRLGVEAGALFSGLPAGASVAVNGVCLTLAAVAGTTGEFDVVPETLRLTNLGSLRPGGRVNLERSLRAGDRLDGHIVQGHVDAAGRVQRVDRGGGEWKLWVAIDSGLMPFIGPKGSIALDGVSLTLVDVEASAFSVVLIPTTLERTTLGERRAGDLVNVETDILARIAVRRVDAVLGGLAALPGHPSLAEGGAVDWAQLKAAGFIA